KPRQPLLNLALTEPFGQGTFYMTIPCGSPFPAFAVRNLSREAEPMVAPGPTTLHLVADEETSKRRQILEGARKVFMDLGFDGASMGEIARAAGVSKGTLYVYFADKSQLFSAIVEREAIEQGRFKFDLSPGRNAEVTLREFGQAYMEILCRPQGASAIRTGM